MGSIQDETIAVIGLGYVGLPVAMAFAEKYRVTGFDIDALRIKALKEGIDHTHEADINDLRTVMRSYNNGQAGLSFTTNAEDMRACTTFIITVPTPIDAKNKPDLALLKNATKTVGQLLKKGDLVIYESTVYPGCTEEVAVPLLEEISGLVFNEDFFCGYSPERINPGDRQRTIRNIQKITAGSNVVAANRVDALYSSIVEAGTYRAPSIKVAEAAKVIENTQRDVNIAFVNELAKIFHLLGIDTQEVLKAASTKWNFLPFQPGLVGGHCIGIDPYYLAEKARAVGYEPQLILEARKMNDSMGAYIATRVVDLMLKKGISIAGAEVLVMGIAFKENFADVRNSRVIDMIGLLAQYHAEVTIYDPLVSPELVSKEYGVNCLTQVPGGKKFDAVVVAVAHDEFLMIDYQHLLKDKSILFDVKGKLKRGKTDGKL